MPIDHITPAGTSVLDELGLDRDFIVKAKFAIRIAKTVRDLGIGQREAAAIMGISQPKLSQLSRGKLDGLSEEKLEKCLVALGHDITITISSRHDGIGTRKILELV